MRISILEQMVHLPYLLSEPMFIYRFDLQLKASLFKAGRRSDGFSCE